MAAEPTDETPLPTLGERLTGQGHALAARHLPAFPWAGPLAVAMQRAAALDVAHGERFARVEVDTHARRPVWPAGTPGGPAAAHARFLPGATDSGPVPPAAPPAPDPRGRPLEPAVRTRLRAGVGPAADVVRVHDDPAADTLARSHGADAVTFGTDVHFREGRYRPAEEHGFGLLVHEVGHVQAALAPGAAQRRATGAGRAEEEHQVMARERAAVTGTPGPRAVATPTAAPREATPMTAPVGRDVDGSAEPAAAPAAPAVAPPDQLAALRRELVEHVLGDLRRRLRTEFERGG